MESVQHGKISHRSLFVLFQYHSLTMSISSEVRRTIFWSPYQVGHKFWYQSPPVPHVTELVGSLLELGLLRTTSWKTYFLLFCNSTLLCHFLKQVHLLNDELILE